MGGGEEGEALSWNAQVVSVARWSCAMLCSLEVEGSRLQFALSASGRKKSHQGTIYGFPDSQQLEAGGYGGMLSVKRQTGGYNAVDSGATRVVHDGGVYKVWFAGWRGKGSEIEGREGRGGRGGEGEGRR